MKKIHSPNPAQNGRQQTQHAVSTPTPRRSSAIRAEHICCLAVLPALVVDAHPNECPDPECAGEDGEGKSRTEASSSKGKLGMDSEPARYVHRAWNAAGKAAGQGSGQYVGLSWMWSVSAW
jgi:hypothetical protein